MKVSELIAMLSKLDGNMDVVTPDLLNITAVAVDTVGDDNVVVLGDSDDCSDDEDFEDYGEVIDPVLPTHTPSYYE